MKNYKFLIPIALIAVFLFSFYQLYSMRTGAEKQYRTLIEAARKQSAEEIYVDAEASYLQALELRPTLDLYLEIGDFYKNTDQDRKTEKWGEQITELYPKESRAYELLMEYYYGKQDYAACYEAAEQYAYWNLASEKVDLILQEIGYKYYLEEEYDDVSIFSEDFCAVQTGDKWGYSTKNGKKVISAEFMKAGPFGYEVAPVIDTAGEAYFIDYEGNKKINLSGLGQIVDLGVMTSSGFCAYDGKTWNYYDKDLNLLFGGYEEATPIGNGVAAVKNNDKWTLIGSDGSPLLDKAFANVVRDEKGIVSRYDRCFVQADSYYEMIDTAGTVYATGLESARLFTGTGPAAVEKGGLWGFLDQEGQMVIDYQYEEARSFSNGMAAICKGGLWGFIDEQGDPVIEPCFEDARDFNEYGNAFIKRDGKWQILRLYKYNH